MVHCVSLCSVFNLNNKNVNARNFQYQSLVRYRNFSLIVSKLMQVNPDNSRAMSALTRNYSFINWHKYAYDSER